jgi:uncharacterized membrane protein YhhN
MEDAMNAHHAIAAVLIIPLVLLIRAEFARDDRKIYVLKPFCTLLVIAAGALSLAWAPAHLRVYAAAVVAALFLSLAGDVALMLRTQSWFRAGLVVFLMAHLVYAAAFTRQGTFASADITIAVFFVIVAAAMYRYLYPGIEGLRAPVLVYVMVITFMMIRAVSTFFDDFFTARQALFIAAGSGLFYLSDIVLAVARFRVPFKYNRASLALYYAGQYLLAVSAAA